MKRKHTREDYDSAIAAFRKDAPRYRHNTAASFCDVDPKTLKKWWESGAPANSWEPIKLVIARELDAEKLDAINRMTEKRRAVQQTKEQELEQLNRAHNQEQQIVNLSRGGALQVLVASTSLISNARALADVAQTRIKEDLGREANDAKRMDASTAIGLLERLASCQAKIVTMARTSLELERLHTEKPKAAASGPADAVSLEEAELRVAAANAALEHARKANGFHTVTAAAEVSVGQRVRLT